MNNSIKFVLIASSLGAVLMSQVNSAPVDAPVDKPAAQKKAVAVRSVLAEKTADKEQPFRKKAQAFVDAYAKRDSKAIGELFTEKAEFHDEFGELTVGRDAIVDMFQDVFDTTPDALVDEINIERVRFITNSVALEEGVVATTEYPGGAREVNRYIALHVKEGDGEWRINTLKDYTREKGTRGEHLSQLAWLVGDWVSEDPSSVVHTTCKWSDDGNFLLRRFTVKIQDKPVMNGVQRIGWDPLRREIRSWVFDSNGGHVEGTWKRNGDQWLVTSSGFNADGESASGVAVYTIFDAERITWQYRNLVIGNELREDTAPIVMVRRPPTVQIVK
ncbi:MAG: nuclear transport factor 2 family protein [Planctomycetaceae bacterium]|jgi:uncharacterized protein (TIGR02246 family)|nr:nuclear transport factor 2 family protein [Planctomycetaceae bacterium]MBT6486105.1 nuclear transport factor 2 family protein [Planctomycetaceae bacterium]MBT6495602.1 nuclear transport factor 2 family protein [Planctomycetaceae bacterium]